MNPTQEINLSRLSILACALGGTAIQAIEKLKPVAEATAVGACAWLAPLAVVGGALAALGIDRMADALNKKKEMQDATRELLTNRDIALAQARAIQARLRKCAEQLGSGTLRDEQRRLLALAEAAEIWWLEAVSNPLRAELAHVRDDQIVAQITPHLTGKNHLILDELTWAELLTVADQRTKGEPKLTSEMVAYFAQKLGDFFAHDLVEALKTDLEKGGKAYAAVSLRFFAEILSGVREVSEDQAELKPLLQRVPELLEQAREAVAALRSAGLPAELEAALAGAERRLADAVVSLSREMHERFDRLEKAAAELRADLAARGVKPTDLSREELERELASRVDSLTPEELHRLVESARFRADISRIIKYAPADLIGREAETKLLHDAWDKVRRAESPRPHVLTIVAVGGEGKTSLIENWAAELAHQDWPGCDAVFAWSFYSQGTREQTAVSSDLFLSEALTFFGDAAMAGSAQGAFDKGRRLAQLVGERRALLILDGLEPLQYAPTSPTPGELKDQGLAALLKGLAATSHGLCVVTTRYAIADLRAFREKTAPEIELKRLSTKAGVDLLQKLGVRKESGSKVEFDKLVEDVKGHALTLNLLGTYLRDAHAGDIRKRDLVKLAEADAEEQGGHAFRVMDAYVKWFEGEGEEAGRRVRGPGLQGVGPVPSPGAGQRALAVLRLLGLFDRPATAGCLTALLKAPAIPGLTDALVGMSEAQRNLAFTRLETAKLLTVNRDAVGTLLSLDAHPLLREYFAVELKRRSGELAFAGDISGTRQSAATNAWRAAHRRLYEHLCATTPDKPDATLEDLQPLYQAVAHGCQAGLQQEADEKVYFGRIKRGEENYSLTKLGAFGSDLGAIACFFETPWSRLSPALPEEVQAWYLNEAAFLLRALGRLTEALEPIRAGLEYYVTQENWDNAARSAGNLSELELLLGEVSEAVRDAEQSVTYADRSGDAGMRVIMRASHADALHQAGSGAEAKARFREAEEMQAESKPANPLLYSLRGFQYCDLLLLAAERAAWLRILQGETTFLSPGRKAERSVGDARSATGMSPLLESIRAVSERAAQTLKWATTQNWLLDIALDPLTLGRAALYTAILDGTDGPLVYPGSPQRGDRTSNEIATARHELNAAVAGLRRAGTQDYLPRGLLTRAWLRSLIGTRTGPESAQSDLDEAWEIAERGPMPLFMADIHLHRARLFGTRNAERGVRNEETKYPWVSPQADLAEARRLIEKHGYGRRKEELGDAEKAARFG